MSFGDYIFAGEVRDSKDGGGAPASLWAAESGDRHDSNILNRRKSYRIVEFFERRREKYP